MCTICKHLFANEHRLRLHLKKHMQDAHEGTTACKTCCHEFNTTIDYFNHFKYHKKGLPLEAGGEMRECPVCKKSVGALSWGNHVASCRRKADQNYIMCDKCDFKTTVKVRVYSAAKRSDTKQIQSFKFL